MMHKHLCGIAATALLAACGGGGGSSGGSSDAGVSPSLGLIRNATVNFYRANDPACPLGCELLDTGNTGSAGTISVNISNYNGPLVIEVVGGGSAEYFDEAEMTFLPLTADNKLRAITPTARGRYGVTLLTELAYQRAVQEDRFPLTTAAVNDINTSIRTALVPDLNDILATPALFSVEPQANSLLNNQSALYAAYLAGFAVLGAGESTPALAVLNALVDDIRDGKLDGKQGDTDLDTPYNPSTLGTDLKTAMQGFVAAYGNNALQTRVDGIGTALTLDIFTPAEEETDPGDDPGPGDGEPEPGGSEVLGNNSGITLLVDGTRYTSTSVTSYMGAPLSVGGGFMQVGKAGDVFKANASYPVGGIGISRNCAANGVPSMSIEINSKFYTGTPDGLGGGGTCTLTTTALTDLLMHTTFSGTFVCTACDPQESVAVTDGEIQYVVQTFAPGNGAAQVAASFEGMNAGVGSAAVSESDTGWKGAWTNITVVNSSASPLSVTPAGGDALSGGDRAVSSLGEHAFSKVFHTDEVYASFLLRVNPGSGGVVANRVLTFSNQAVYIGVAGNQFQGSIGETEEKVGTVENNVTYHIVGRLYKDGGSALYNRLDFWVDPAINAQDNPLKTLQFSGSGTGSMKFIDKTQLLERSQSNTSQPIWVDRIRFSDSWEGLFGDVMQETDTEE